MTESDTDTGVRGGVDRAETGEFVEKYSDDDVVGVLAEAFPEPLSATEIAERVGCARMTVHNRAERLVEDDVVRTKRVGARSRVYWLAVRPADLLG